MGQTKDESSFEEIGRALRVSGDIAQETRITIRDRNFRAYNKKIKRSGEAAGGASPPMLKCLA